MTPATKNASRDVHQQPSLWWLWIVFLLATLLYGVTSVWLLDSYMQLPYDLAIYDQSLWLLAHGESFITVAGFDVNSAHFSPVLYLISPISFVPGGATPELVLQALMIASGVFPAAKLGELFQKDGRWFAFAYVIHPAIVGGSWYGWRPWNIAVPVFMWLVYWVVTNPNWMRLSLAGLIMLIFREDLAVWVGLLAVTLALAHKVSWMAVIKSGLVLGSATAVVVFGILPASGPVDGYYFASEHQVWGGTPSVLLASVVSRAIFLLVPLALLLNRSAWLLMVPLALPIIGLTVRGGNSLSTFFHYDMMFVPMLLVVVALSTTVTYRPKVLAVASLLVLVGLGALRPFPPRGGGNPLEYNSELVAVLDEARALIEAQPISASNASMTLPDLLVPHYSERSNIFIYPFPTDLRRDTRGEPSAQLRFDCPEPNLVVARPDSLSIRWRESLQENYTRSDSPSGRLALWVRDDRAPNSPCTARLVDSIDSD